MNLTADLEQGEDVGSEASGGVKCAVDLAHDASFLILEGLQDVVRGVRGEGGIEVKAAECVLVYSITELGGEA